MHANFPIIDKLGGRAAVRAELARRGVHIGQRAIGAWNERRNIPGRIHVLLMNAANERGVEWTPDDFVHPQAPATMNGEAA